MRANSAPTAHGEAGGELPAAGVRGACAKMNAMEVQTVTFTPVSPAEAGDPVLREQLLDTWMRVTDAGGAVGFVPPADRGRIADTLDQHLPRVLEGRDALGVLRRGDERGPAAGMGILAASSSPLRTHWRTVLRLMVDPDLQGIGAGRVLIEGLHEMGRALGLEFVCLTVRGGLGIEGFYERIGYEVHGRNPRAIRVAPGDERDEIHMRYEL
jgi:GNAT superfamily N-acetyltransferase